MRAVIKGKLYDTKNAVRVAEWSSPHTRGDFHRADEELFRTRKGAWFLAGEGGALSRWGEPTPRGGWGSGSGILPLSKAGARAWCEQHDVDADTIAAHFTVEEA
jgi:hypothetical protein